MRRSLLSRPLLLELEDRCYRPRQIRQGRTVVALRLRGGASRQGGVMASRVLCGQCGAQGDADDQFCGSCGAPRSAADQLATPVAQDSPAAFTVEPPSRGPATANHDGEILSPVPPSPPAVAAVMNEPAPPVEAPARPAKVPDPPVKGQSRVRALVGPSPDQLVGDAAPNSTYLGLRQLYEKPAEASFDPLLNTKWIGLAFLRALFFTFLWFVTGFVFFVLCLLLLIVANNTAIFGLYIVGAIVSGIAFTLLWFFLRVPAVVSEWKFAVDRKGAAETTAFEHITWAFQQRETPVKSLRVRRISQPGIRTRDYLEVKDGVFSGYVSCFAYGEDLYIGWTFLDRPLAIPVVHLARPSPLSRGHPAGHGALLVASLRQCASDARGHARGMLAREWTVATGEIKPQGQGIVGSEVGIDLTTLTSND